MTPIDAGLGLAGFILAMLMVSRVGHWAMALHELRSQGARWTALASASAVSSGPWMLAIVALGGYQVRHEPWVLPMAIGAVVGFAFIALLIVKPATRRKAEWAPGQLIVPDRSLRRILWWGRHKAEYMTLYGLVAGLLYALVMDYDADWKMPLLGDAFFFAAGYLGGMLFGWFMWQLGVWPIYAAFPGTTWSPPGERVYEDVPELKPASSYSSNRPLVSRSRS